MSDKDGNDFVVSESTGRDVEFVGGTKEFKGGGSKNSGGKQLNNNSAGMVDHQQLELDDDDVAISSEPAIGAMAVEPTSNSNRSQAAASKPTNEPETNRKSGEGIRKLSTQQVKQIEANLYGSKSGLVSGKEKEELSRKVQDHIGETGDTSTPSGMNPGSSPHAASNISADPDMPRVTMAKKTKGLAYFYKNYIEIVGSIEMHDHDDLQINDRSYTLKQKRISPQIKWGVGIGVMSAVLLLVASLFIKDAGNGMGEITGIVLDDNSQPYVQGATIRFPDLGVSVKSNPAGFFRSGDVPEGTHKIQYLVDGKVIGEDFATTVNGDVTMIALHPMLAEQQIEDPSGSMNTQMSSTTTEQQQMTTQSAPTRQPETRTTQQVANTNTTSSTPTTQLAQNSSQPTTKSGTSKSSDPARLKLAANVPQARLVLDGKVLGAGNTTFTKLQPGTRKYTVSRDGYQDASGTVTLNGGEEVLLTVNLQPIPKQTKEVNYTESDYCSSARAALEAGDVNRAIEEYNKAIDMKPSYAKAYFGRGEARVVQHDMTAAHDDFVQAAEIFKMNGEYSDASTAYNRAVEADKKSVTALLGRADLYLARGEEIAAIADYESVIKLDRKNFDANFGIGQARYRQGNYRAAIDYLKNARSIDDRNPDVHETLVLCYMATGDLKSMKKSWEKFEEIASSDDMGEFRKNASYPAIMAALER